VNPTTVSAQPEASGVSIEQLHAQFLAILPRIQTHAEICFRYLKCPGKHADAIADTVALAWMWFLRVTEQGKDVTEFVGTLADFAVRHVRAGRKLCGQDKAKDVLSPRAQQMKSFTVEPLASSTRKSYDRLYADPHGQDHMDAMEERLRDNTQSPVADQAAFRVDYPEWLLQLGHRNCEIAKDMALEVGTFELADKHKVSAGRISQLRREFYKDWQRFHGEVV
jgi:hypothetical protein